MCQVAHVTDRKTEILEAAIELIVDEGYSSLTMRALARNVGVKLASLQYHFRTTEDLLRAVVTHIGDSYTRSVLELQEGNKPPTLRELVIFILKDEAGAALHSDRLWPQLWAMQQVQPLVSEMVEEIYSRYLFALEESLRLAGSGKPRAESLCLMSMLEGTTLFMGKGRRWEQDADEVAKTILNLIERNWTTEVVQKGR